MLFIETRPFTRRISKILSTEEDRGFQLALAADPELGKVMVGTGGLRKIRWSALGQGKSGGARVIYFYDEPRSRVFLLLVHRKNEQDSLTPEQKSLLRNLIDREVP